MSTCPGNSLDGSQSCIMMGWKQVCVIVRLSKLLQGFDILRNISNLSSVLIGNTNISDHGVKNVKRAFA